MLKYGNPCPYYRAQAQAKGQLSYYRCRARHSGRKCDQGGLQTETFDQQGVSILRNLKPPENWRQHITRVMSEALGEQNLEARLAEIRATIERMDFQWDNGFIIDKMDYLEKRVQLQQELEQLIQVPDDDLQRAVDILHDFGKHWDACNCDPEAENRLVRLIVEPMYVEDERVVAMTLKSDCTLF